MNAQELLRSQFEQAHQLLEGAIGDVDAAILNHREGAWKINPIGAIYSHVAIAEDAMVNAMALGREPLLVRGGWAEKLGVTETSPRQVDVPVDFAVDLETARAFAQAVAAETNDFLSSASEDVLNKEIDGAFGKSTVIGFLSTIGLTHVAGHWGEIAALKGVQGQKGLAF